MTRLILAIWLILLLGACSDRPSAQAGRDAFERHMMEGVGDTEFSLTGFRKTDGQAFEQDGVKGYRLIFTSDVAFPRGYQPDCHGSNSIAAGLKCLEIATIIARPKPVPPGSTVSLAGNIVFQRTENGWIPVQILMARAESPPPAR